MYLYLIFSNIGFLNLDIRKIDRFMNITRLAHEVHLQTGGKKSCKHIYVCFSHF